MVTFRQLAMGAVTAATMLLSGVALAAPALDLQRSLDRARHRAAAPGMTVAVIRSDSVAVAVSGVRHLGRPGRVAVEDRFHVGSEAKAMLGTLVAQQVEAGRLRWETTIEDVLPEVTTVGLPIYRHVTIADLLRHRSGLVQLEALADLAEVPVFSGPLVRQRLAFATWALQQPPVAVPGTATRYSNAGYVVLAAMLERVTGCRYERLLQQRLLRPLGARAQFGWPAAGGREAPWGHLDDGRRLVPVSPAAPTVQVPPWVVPAGHLSLSTHDFAHFVQLHLRGLEGIAAGLTPASFIELHRPVDGYAAGWAVAGDGRDRISFHAGGSDLFYALMVVAPGRDVAAVVLVNADTPAVREAAAALAAQVMTQAVQP